jgi:hypothetical protein
MLFQAVKKKCKVLTIFTKINSHTLCRAFKQDGVEKYKGFQENKDTLFINNIKIWKEKHDFPCPNFTDL